MGDWGFGEAFRDFMGGKKEPDEPAHYFCGEFTKAERDMLVSALGRLSPTTVVRKLTEKVELLRRVDLPLESVDWAALEERARLRGSSLADLFWDNPKEGK